MAEDTRRPRELESREKSPARTVYAPPSALPDPMPEPGYGYRWIATHIMGGADPANVSKRMREGWEPVKAADHPELMLNGNEKTGNVEIGGLMLCKAPAEMIRSRGEYYARQAQAQIESVDNSFFRENDARMPLFADRKSRTSVGQREFGNGN